MLLLCGLQWELQEGAVLQEEQLCLLQVTHHHPHPQDLWLESGLLQALAQPSLQGHQKTARALVRIVTKNMSLTVQVVKTINNREDNNNHYKEASSKGNYLTNEVETPGLQAPLCGLEGTSPFVFGGQEAKPGQFPFMISFVYTDQRYH